ncbi:MAG: SMP-30/gluconolactonase/LRE family protein [Planctomycetia bacterium]|nr:SMP-30/gluconolactonase/LRE family protein [Planctomycetia bacterium]
MRLFCDSAVWRIVNSWTAMLLFAVSVNGSTSSCADEPTGELAKKLAGVTFEQYAPAPGYSEGPTWFRGEVFFCSGPLLRVDADHKVHKHLDLGPAGTVLRADGHMLICDNKYKALLDLSPEGKVGVIVDQFETRPLRSLNDLSIDGRGNVYWTDPEGSTPQTPVGNVFRARPDGRVDRVATGLAFPNGLDVDPASKHLYVIESQSKKILRYALPKDNELCGPPELFYDLGGSGGDGCTFDSAGNLWVTDFHRPETGKGRITVLSPKAEVLAYLPLPTKVVSNIAFGGPKHDEIFCTTGDPPGVFHAVVGVKGFAGHPGKPMPISRTLDLVVQRTHADAETLRAIAKVAADAKVNGGQLDDDARQQVQSLVAKLSDPQIRGDVDKLLPELNKAAARHAADRPLLAEVKRLGGKATLDIAAPDWLRSIAGDESLEVFGRIAELNLNERTDGHKEPDAKAITQRVNDDTLKLLVGQDALRRLELSGTAVASAGLIHLKGLTNLQFLNVCLTAVSDEGFEHLAALTKMRRMTVCASKITGSGFKHLAGMTQLESINLHSSPASDAGLEAIGKLPSLRRLEIVHTNVTDAGLAHVANLINLRQLHIHGKETTEAALPFIGKLQELYELDIYDKAASNATLKEIGKLPKLRMLRFFGGPLDDDGVKHLAGLTTLEDLVLNTNQVTDAAIEHLAGLKNVRTINVGGSKITAAGKQRLKMLLPKVEVTP